MSRMPSTSTGTASVSPCASAAAFELDAQRVGFRRQHQRERRRAPRAAPARGGRSTSWPDQRDQRLLEQVLDRRAAGRSTGSVTTACASSPSITSVNSRSDAPSFTRSRTPGARSRRSATSAGTSHRLAVPTTPRRACPASRPCSIERSARIASSSRCTRRRPLEHDVAELGGLRAAAARARAAARRARPRAGGPGRTRSTARCSARRPRPVNEPSSAIASSVSRWRSCIVTLPFAPGTPSEVIG